MKRKTKKILSALSVVVGAALFAVVPFAARAVAESEKVIWDTFAFETQYNLGETLVLPKVKAQQGGASQTARSFVYSPSGRAEEMQSVAFKEFGLYEVEYRAVFGGKLYKQTRRIEVGNKIVTTDMPTDTVEYAAETATNKSGLEVRMSQGSSLRVNRVIDLRRVSADTPILELFVTPEMAEKRDFAGIKIEIADAYDPTNAVVVDYAARTDLRERGYSMVWAGASNGELKGTYPADGEAYEASSGKGSLIATSFYGGQYISNGLELYYDHLTNEVFGAKRTDGLTLNGVALSDLIVDVDSAENFEKPFVGFKTGEVKLSITPYNFNGKAASFVITELAGADLSSGNYFREEITPEIKVDFGGYGEEELPCAIVGKPYPLFDATYLSSTSFDRRVYREYYGSARVEMNLKNGAFTPDLAGNYTIVYSAVGNYGNVVEKVVSVKAYDATSVPTELRLTNGISDETPLFGIEGEKIGLPQQVYEGGSGKVTMRVAVRTAAGEEIPCDEKFFFPEMKGVYTVVFYAEDYAGQVARTELSCTVAENLNPVFLEEIVLPEYLIAGKKYALPAWTATQFGANKAEYTAQIEATGGNLQDNVFIPSETVNEAVITYTAISDSGSQARTFRIPVVKVKQDGKLQLSRYFYTTNLTGTAENNHLHYVVSDGATQAEMEFINPLFAEYFTLDFFVRGEYGGMKSVDVSLRDSANGKETVFLRFEKNADGSAKTSVNGLGVAVPVSVGFDGNAEKEYFSVAYDAANKAFVCDGRTLRIFATLDGAEFRGFTSGKVYASVRINGVSGAAGVGVRKINNQILTKIVADTIAPEIVSSDFFGTYKHGDELTLQPAYALDVVDPEVKFTLSVEDRFGNAVVAKDGTVLTEVDPSRSYTIVLSEYGSYSFFYTAVDTSKRENSYPVGITVCDDVDPVIEIESSYAAAYKRGKKLKIQKALVKDNMDEETSYSVFLKTPDGQINAVTETSVTLSVKGTYTLTYMAIDSSGNIATLIYTFAVK